MSKIIEVKAPGEAFGADKDWGPLIPFVCEVEGQGEVTINRKPDSGPPPVGAEVASITSNDYGKRGKLAQAGGGRSGGGKNFEADSRKLRSENYRSALHAAVDMCKAEVIKAEQVIPTADRFYDAIEEKGKVGE